MKHLLRSKPPALEWATRASSSYLAGTRLNALGKGEQGQEGNRILVALLPSILSLPSLDTPLFTPLSAPFLPSPFQPLLPRDRVPLKKVALNGALPFETAIEHVALSECAPQRDSMPIELGHRIV